jgi:hypothetical protein
MGLLSKLVKTTAAGGAVAGGVVLYKLYMYKRHGTPMTWPLAPGPRVRDETGHEYYTTTDKITSLPSAPRVVIVGAGTAGITVAAQLARKLPHNRDIVLVDSAKMHYYQPGWTLVGNNLMSKEDTGRPTASLIPNGVCSLSFDNRFQPISSLLLILVYRIRSLVGR